MNHITVSLKNFNYTIYIFIKNVAKIFTTQGAPPVSTTLTGVIDTGEFTAGVNNTDGHVSLRFTSIAVTPAVNLPPGPGQPGKIASSIGDISSKFAASVSKTPVINNDTISDCLLLKLYI
jgi:hypothetical protein